MNAVAMRNLRTSYLSQRFSSKKSPARFPILLIQQPPAFDFLLPFTNTAKPFSRSKYSQQRRYASTSSTTTPASSITPELDSQINAPLTTLPAPITSPVRLPNQSRFSYLLALGKTYVKFYKTGIINVKNNFVASRPLLSKIDKHHGSSVIAAARADAVTRAEFQLLRRSMHDIKRVPMFALVVLICGEFTPLVVIALSNVVPWTCRIPRQIEADRKKLEARRAISFRNLTLPPPDSAGVEHLQRMQLLHISWSLGLSSRMWDWLGGQLPGLPTGLLRRKIERRVEYLEIDDALIQRYGGVEEMSVEEVKMACVDRGIDILGRKDAEIRRDLGDWLGARAQEAPIERLLLTRPSAWPIKVSKSQSQQG